MQQLVSQNFEDTLSLANSNLNLTSGSQQQHPHQPLFEPMKAEHHEHQDFGSHTTYGLKPRLK
jgi:hypothetical protein